MFSDICELRQKKNAYTERAINNVLINSASLIKHSGNSDLDIVGTVYHLVIYMQSNKIHNVV